MCRLTTRGSCTGRPSASIRLGRIPGLYAFGPGITFGVGFGIGFFGGFGWGFHHWDADWRHREVDFDHHHFVSHSRTFIDRNHFFRGGPGFHGGPGFRGGQAFHGGPAGRAQPGARTGAFSGFNHGGVTRGFSARGQSSAAHAFHGGAGSTAGAGSMAAEATAAEVTAAEVIDDPVHGALVLAAVAVYAPPGGAQQPHQKTFSSTDEAANALFVAVQAGDKGLSDLFGGEDDLFAADDEGEADLDRQRFVEKFRRCTALRSSPRVPSSTSARRTGRFPSRSPGMAASGLSTRRPARTRSSSAASARTNRRRIDTCDALARSDEHTAAFLDKPIPIRGYYFRALSGRGKPAAFLAYPAEYGSSGVMTFVVDREVIYQRDLALAPPKPQGR